VRRPSLTLRLRLTLLCAGVFFLAGAALLSVSYVLVRNNLTPEPSQLRALSPDGRELARAATSELRESALHELRVQYALALAAMTAISVLLGWAVAGRGLRPLQRITATARRVSQDNLDERIALAGPRDELTELADTFDGMLERLEGAFASQRRFVANASHELRTPLTVMRTELEVAIADPDATTDELREMAEAVRASLGRTERLIDALLTLARSESAVTRRDDVDLAALARLAVDQARGELSDARLRLTTGLAPAPVRGNRRLLERLVANLVDNSVRHNRPGGGVDVSTGVGRDRAFVRVTNDGEPLPPDALPRLLEPFQRLDRHARGDGAGLGLSIVASVARAHGGTVELEARATGGLDAVVELPLSPGAAPSVPDPALLHA
jgi:signal transduction histidine kinase